VEHGLRNVIEGKVTVRAERAADHLRVSVSDNGPGIDASTVGQGLGTQIIRTLVENELSATIEWSRGESGGTVVTIEIPLRYIAAAKGVK